MLFFSSNFPCSVQRKERWVKKEILFLWSRFMWLPSKVSTNVVGTCALLQNYCATIYVTVAPRLYKCGVRLLFFQPSKVYL